MEYNDKTRMASYRSDTFVPDNLIAGPRAIERRKMTLVTGTLARGAVLGRVLGTATPAAAAGNTGAGTMGAVTLGANAKKGVYRVTFIEPASGLGTFTVEDPDGKEVGTGKVGTAFAGPVNFTIADGDPDFVSGDGFTIAVVNADSDVKLSAAAATDGSQIPIGILVHDADASEAEQEVLVYTYGDFNKSALSFGAGHTADTVHDALRAIGIHLVNVLPN